MGVGAEGPEGGRLHHDAERAPHRGTLPGLHLHREGVGAQIHEGQAAISDQGWRRPKYFIFMQNECLPQQAFWLKSWLSEQHFAFMLHHSSHSVPQ